MGLGDKGKDTEDSRIHYYNIMNVPLNKMTLYLLDPFYLPALYYHKVLTPPSSSELFIGTYLDTK